MLILQYFKLRSSNLGRKMKLGDASVILLKIAVCLACVQVSQQQIVKANLTSTRLCSIPDQAVRVLPSAGFSRTPIQSWADTQYAPGSNPATASLDLKNCLFWSFSPEFEELLGPNPTIYQVGPSLPSYTYTETPAFFPDTNEIVFSSASGRFDPLMPPFTTNNISRLSLTNGSLNTVPVNPPIGNTAGMSYYKHTGKGQVIVAGRGDPTDSQNPPGIFLLDPTTGNTSILVNNWFGQRFAGFNDVIALKDGTIIMTHENLTASTVPPFAVSVGGNFPYGVWVLPAIGGAPRPLIGHTQIPGGPNGLALSDDETTLYVSMSASTSSLIAMDPNAEAAVNQIFAFELEEIDGGYFASGPRTFAESDYGFADGIKTDIQGNVYAPTSDGVSVWNPAGTLIGKILLPTTLPLLQHPSTAVGFANNNLIIMHLSDCLMLPLNSTGPSFVVNG